MLARVFTCAVIGLDGVVVEVEVDTGGGLTSIVIVGLPDAAVQESRERVQGARNNTGLYFPWRRMIVNRALAAVRKECPANDLPILYGILIASGQVPPECADVALFLGELSLDGRVRHVGGVLPMASTLAKFFPPAVDAAEASLIPEVSVYPVESLNTLLDHLVGVTQIQPQPHIEPSGVHQVAGVDLKKIKGQE